MSSGSPRACSELMYETVPNTMPGSVAPAVRVASVSVRWPGILFREPDLEDFDPSIAHELERFLA